MDALSVAGVILSALTFPFAYLIYILQSKNRHLSYFVHQNYPLILRSLSQHELELKYKGTSLTDKTVRSIRVTIVNSSSFDLSANDYQGPLQMVLDEGTEWLNVTVIKKSNALSVDLKISNNVVETIPSLFKRMEFYTIEGIYAQSETSNYEIKFIQRIKNIDKVRQIPSRLIRPLFETVVFNFIPFIFVLIGIGIAADYFKKNVMNILSEEDIVYVDNNIGVSIESVVSDATVSDTINLGRSEFIKYLDRLNSEDGRFSIHIIERERYEENPYILFFGLAIAFLLIIRYIIQIIQCAQYNHIRKELKEKIYRD